MGAGKVARIGESVLRKEDHRLVTGHGAYTADHNLPGQAHAKIVRAATAHARIASIDVDAALELPGVLAVLTGADLIADGLQPLLHDHNLLGDLASQREAPDVYVENIDGTPSRIPPHHLLAIDRVRYVGEPVAIVIAETVETARQAVDLVYVEYDDLPCVVRALDALEDDAPQLWDMAPGNISIRAQLGDPDRTEAAFASAAHVVRLETVVQRISGVPMEPRAALGDYDPETGKHTVYACCSGVIRHKRELTQIFQVKPEQARMIAKDVGGSFGTRNAFYSEFGLVTWAAKRLGRPVKWVGDRSECFLSDYQGRDLSVSAELALDADGRFLALRGVNTSNIGAYAVSHWPMRKGAGLMTNVYAVPTAHFIAQAVFTNTVPTAPVRSAGRPEAMFVIERLVDLAADQLGIDRIELRRRNLIAPADMPYANPLGLTYDNGEYESCMDWALRLSEWDGFPARKAEAASRGRLRGIGLANYVEITTGPPIERADITVGEDGIIEVAIGTVASGQGHETSFGQLISDWLNVPLDAIRHVAGDTDRVVEGGGSVSGRSMRFAGVVIGKAVEGLVVKCRTVVGAMFAVPAEEIEFSDGKFFAAGSDQRFTIFDVAREMRVRNDLPVALRGPLQESYREHFRTGGYPYGTQVCEVEINPEDGEITLVRVAAVDDVGRAVNPMIVDGQTHGGAAMGYGQALMEQIYYDPDSGQPLTGSFMDYAMPHAHDMPFFDTAISEVPSPTNPLGIRAGGEGGTTPALAVAVNAIVDALSHYGIKHLEMPVTASKVWDAIQQAKQPAHVGASA